MARIPPSVWYGVDCHQFGEDVAAKRMAANYAKALREGITAQEALDLAKLLDAIASGAAPTVALGFTKAGRPTEFERDSELHERIEELHASGVALADCYKRLAKDGLSPSRVKQIHLCFRKAARIARGNGED